MKKLYARSSVAIKIVGNALKFTINYCKIFPSGMPKYYLVKAFILDNDLVALTNSYTYYENTLMYKNFIETVPTDFDENSIISFSDDEEDFGALTDSVIKADINDEMTIEYDEEKGVYTFINASEEIKNLSIGEVFCYEDDNNFILLKVKYIDVSDSTVTITEDDNISVEEAFDYIRIDESTDFSQFDKNSIETGSCVEQDVTLETSSFDVIDENDKTVFTSSFKVNYPKTKSDDEKAYALGYKLTGSVNLKITASTRLHVDLRHGNYYCEFKTDLTASFDIDFRVTGSISLNKNKVKIDLSGEDGIPIGRFLMLYTTVYPIANVTGTVDVLKINIVSRTIASVNSADGLRKDSSVIKSVKDSKVMESTITLNVGVGVDFSIGRKLGKKDLSGIEKIIGTISVSVQGYFSLTLTPFNLVHTLFDGNHDCYYCATGTISGTVSGTVSVQLKFFDAVDIRYDLISIGKTWTLGTAYFSISSNGIAFGMGNCPHIKKSVTISIKDKNNNPVTGATVICQTGFCSSSDSGSEVHKITLNNASNVVFYFPVGKHNITAIYNNKTVSTDINVNLFSKNIEVCVDISNNSENNKTWSDGIQATDETLFTYNVNNGLAVITGFTGTNSDVIIPGTINGYYVDAIGSSAFSGNARLKRVKIPDTVTTIGSQAFSGCSNLETIKLSANLLELGSKVFSGCSKLTSLSIPSGVYNMGESLNNSYVQTLVFEGNRTKIPNHACYYATYLVSVSIPSSVTEIGASAFCNCGNLSNINLPSGLMTVGMSAFSGCSSLAGTDAEEILNSRFGITVASFSTDIITSASDNQETDEEINEDTGFCLEYSGASAGGCYLFIYVTELNENDFISTKTLKYINDIYSDDNGNIIANYSPQDYYENGQMIISSNFDGKKEHRLLNPDIQLNANGGYLETLTKRIKFNEAYGELPIPVKAEYTFVGWANENDEIVVSDTVCDIAKNHTLTAQWAKVNQIDKFIYGQNLSNLISLDNNQNYNITYSNSQNIVGTGTVFNCLDESGQVSDTLTAVVYGDVNGDGSADGMDAVVYRCLLAGMISEDDFGKANAEAANCNHDSNVDEIDLSMVIQSGLGLVQINQEP